MIQHNDFFIETRHELVPKRLINVNYHAKEDKNKGIIRIFAHEKYSASFLLILLNLKFEDYG